MSYEKHTWETGETITAEKLNNLENGVASSGDEGSPIIIVTVTEDSGTYTTNKTYEEALSVINSGGICIFKIVGYLTYYYYLASYHDDIQSPYISACYSLANYYNENKIIFNRTDYVFNSDNTFTKNEKTYFVQTTTP